MDDNDALLVVLAIFFPPIAVAIKFGISGKFWLNLFLTFLFGIPGIIHAICIILMNKSKPNYYNISANRNETADIPAGAQAYTNDQQPVTQQTSYGQQGYSQQGYAQGPPPGSPPREPALVDEKKPLHTTTSVQ